jgi:hypothetical protein
MIFRFRVRTRRKKYWFTVTWVPGESMIVPEQQNIYPHPLAWNKNCQIQIFITHDVNEKYVELK